MDQQNCPACGCNLKEAWERRRKIVKDELEKRHGPSLVQARKKTRIWEGIKGGLLGLLLGLFIDLVIVVLIAVYVEMFMGGKIAWAGSMEFAFTIIIFAVLAIPIVTAIGIYKNFVKSAIPKEEKFLRKQIEEELPILNNLKGFSFEQAKTAT